MIEKTIFIVKPIFVPVHVPVNLTKEAALHSKKQTKMTRKQQKAIYMERQKPPHVVAEERRKSVQASKSRKRQQRSITPQDKRAVPADLNKVSDENMALHSFG